VVLTREIGVPKVEVHEVELVVSKTSRAARRVELSDKAAVSASLRALTFARTTTSECQPVPEAKFGRKLTTIAQGNEAHNGRGKGEDLPENERPLRQHRLGLSNITASLSHSRGRELSTFLVGHGMVCIRVLGDRHFVLRLKGVNE